MLPGRGKAWRCSSGLPTAQPSASMKKPAAGSVHFSWSSQAVAPPVLQVPAAVVAQAAASWAGQSAGEGPHACGQPWADAAQQAACPYRCRNRHGHGHGHGNRQAHNTGRQLAIRTAWPGQGLPMQRAPTDSAAVPIDEEAGFGGAAILLVVARRAAGVAGPVHRGGAVSRGLGRAVCGRGTPRVPPAAGSRGTASGFPVPVRQQAYAQDQANA